MELLKGFKSKSFMEQMGVLTQLSKDKDPHCLQELFLLYTGLTGDKTVDAMVEHTLRDVLAANEKHTVAKITSGNEKEKKLCLQIAGREKFASSVLRICELLKKESNSEVLIEVFIAMAEIQAPDFLDIFRANLRNSNEIISGLSIEMIATYHDLASEGELKKIISEAEADGNYEFCSVSTADAIETLALLKDNTCSRFLASKVHHKNPTARRIIHEELIKLGPKTLPFLRDIFSHSNTDYDQKIMAAGIISRIGDKRGGDILVAAMDKGLAENANVRGAIYEAFGSIKFMKGLVFLVDALDEKELQVLITVVTALDHQVNRAVLTNIEKRIKKVDSHSEKLAQAIVGARALSIFEGLYAAPSIEIRESLLDVLLNSNDPQCMDIFAKKLDSIPGEIAAADRAKLTALKIEKRKRHILAVDDSKPMRLFYRSVISRMNMDVTLAEHGQNALNILFERGGFDLIVTDLNMPVMDGIEFTRKVRENSIYDKIPIIMGTTESASPQVKLAEKSGVNDFISKPIQTALLQEKIKSLLDA
ncbi:MAG: response regulator [bacterium]|nr:response regulator [bacterium]